jgi:hypothetical protein
LLLISNGEEKLKYIDEEIENMKKKREELLLFIQELKKNFESLPLNKEKKLKQEKELEEKEKEKEIKEKYKREKILLNLIKLDQIEECLALFKEHILYETLNKDIFLSIFNKLNEPLLLNEKLVLEIIDFFSQVIKTTSNIKKFDIYYELRSLIVRYNKNLNTRNYIFYLKIVEKIFDSIPNFKILIPNQFSIKTWEGLLQIQSYITMFIISKVKNSWRILNIYQESGIKGKIKKFQEDRSKKNYQISQLIFHKYYEKNYKNNLDNHEINSNSETINENKEDSFIENQEIEILNENDEMNIEDEKKIDNDIDLCQKDLLKIIDENSPNQRLKKLKEDLRLEIEKLLIKIFKQKVEVFKYGSSACNFSLKGSDVDFCIVFTELFNKKTQMDLNSQINYLKTIFQEIESKIIVNFSRRLI